MIFYNFCYYFWGQALLMNRNKQNWKRWFCFLCFHCPQHFYCSPALPLLRRPWICNFCQQTSPNHWFAKREYDVILWRQKQRIPVTMTTICLHHCSILEFGRGHPIRHSPRASLDLCTPLVRLTIKSGIHKFFNTISCGLRSSEGYNQVQLTVE